MNRQQFSSEILFAPGFNPIGSLWPPRDTMGFWGEYVICGGRPWPPPTSGPYQRHGDAWLVSLTPLYTTDQETGQRENLVDHCMLIWLLDRKDMWSDMRRFYKRQDSREGVRLVAQTVTEMVSAHREKWPDWPWSKQQQKIIDWCAATASTGGN